VKKLLFVFGTRPEAIKMAPLIHACKKNDAFDTKVCLTGQHREMLQQVMQFFELESDYNLNLMRPNQTLYDITADALKGMDKILADSQPNCILVQGDTTTAFAGALAAFYKKIKVGHIEAGLRSHNKYAPYPEEANRRMVSVLTDFHFAPTQAAADNLQKEGVFKNVFVTGNTVIDALLWAVKKVREDHKYAEHFNFLDPARKIILVTGHRRENFGEPFENICNALSEISEHYGDVQIVYPVHLNPNVQEVVNRMLSGRKNIFLIAPLEYPHLVWLMDKSHFVITDSGGIQEEAPSLGKPVLVMRDVTERMEGVEAGTAKLVGTSKEKIVSEAFALLDDERVYEAMAKAVNPYGSGNSAEEIVSLLLKYA
jgi:UDP-N-acetylglucosamine 2-epimerase (non-hydrolysing)